jgi:hypothetical protein
MGTTGVVLLVVAIFTVNAIVWVVVARWLRGRMRAAESTLRAKLRDGEKLLVEPGMGTYRGATARFGKVKGTGVVALTDQRVLCVKAVGEPVEVALGEVVAVREDKWFMRSANTLQHVILGLRDGTEVAFQVKDHTRWMETLRKHVS